MTVRKSPRRSIKRSPKTVGRSRRPAAAQGYRALPYYNNYTPPMQEKPMLSSFWGIMDDESTRIKVIILLVTLCFSFYFFIMSCIGLSESKDSQQLDKPEWKAFFSLTLILTFAMVVGIVFIFYSYN